MSPFVSHQYFPHPPVAPLFVLTFGNVSLSMHAYSSACLVCMLICVSHAREPGMRINAADPVSACVFVDVSREV